MVFTLKALRNIARGWRLCAYPGRSVLTPRVAAEKTRQPWAMSHNAFGVALVAKVNPNVTINLSLPVLRHEDLSFPRTRESRRGGVAGRTRMDARFRGHDESRDSLSAQPMTLGKGAGKVGMPALARPRRLFVLRRFVSSGLTLMGLRPASFLWTAPVGRSARPRKLDSSAMSFCPRRHLAS
jgi:hypothetical protein